MSAHMKEGMEAHLSLLSLVVPKLQNTVQQQGDLICALMKLQMKSLVPPVDIVMDDFEKHKRSDDAWYSPPFYTHLGGYRMCLRVDANGNGDGKGTHVSVFVHLMRGEFDDLLKWPFRGEVTIQLKKTDPPYYQRILPLYDDIPNSKPTKEMNDDGRGFLHYIPHAYLYAGGYLKDDKLVFCVSDIVVESK